MELGEGPEFHWDREALRWRLAAARLALVGQFDKAADALLRAERYARRVRFLRDLAH